MLIFSYLVIFIFGLIIGSFLNSIIYRLRTGESFLSERSYCPYCKHQLSWQDLIPIFSFLILRGKCRYCQKPISWQYPLVELITGIISLFIFIEDGPLSGSLYYLIISCFLIIIFVYDLRHYIIPDRVIYPAIFVVIIWYLLFGIIFKQFSNYYILTTIYSATGAAAFFLAIVLVSHGKWMGVGDIKLAFFMGLFLGFPNILVALFLAFFIGAIIGVGLIATGKKTLKSEVPFGPFLVTGTFAAMFWSQSIINWYLHLF